MSKIDEYSIAIIGMAGRFPGSDSLDEFWENISKGEESITRFTNEELENANVSPLEHSNPDYVPNRGVLKEIDKFDASFFGYTPREAQIADPQHRLMLECAWEVFEDAGYVPDKYDGVSGVYVGSSTNTYMINNVLTNNKVMESVGPLQILIGNEKDHLATKIAYKLDLKGPAITVQTACSTSLVSIHMACQSLLSLETDMAMAGGVSINVPQEIGHTYTKNGVGSSDGHCRAFDAKADGTIAGNGAGVVLLKRAQQAIEDGDRIHAIIRGSAINNDGKNKVGYTAPSIQGQAQVIANAQQQAGVTPNSISYIETHGTGTELGDPIEIMGLTLAFEAMGYENFDKKCAIGSLKPNIGHLDAASGIASLIKCVLALKNGELPPSINYTVPNPEIQFATSPFYVNTKLKKWSRTEYPRRCGISSFGIGGTNAHVVLEEAPDAIRHQKRKKSTELFALSAKSQYSLKQNAKNLAQYIKYNQSIPLEDISYTLRSGRTEFNYKEALTAGTREELIEKLERLQNKNIKITEGKIRQIFLFSGQGSCFAGAGKELYELFPVFRETIDACSDYAESKLCINIREILLDSNAKELISKTEIAQPALFILEYALFKLIDDLGIKPEALMGHSIGEYTAACVAGALSMYDMLDLVIKRGKIMAKAPFGRMLAIFSSEEEITPYLTNGISISAKNAPRINIVSGEIEEIKSLSKILKSHGIKSQKLKVKHGFHSQLMDPVLEEFREFANNFNYQPLKIPLISNNGSVFEAGTLLEGDYWVDHLRNPVEFRTGLEKTLSMSAPFFLEIGPDSVLTSLVHYTLDNNFAGAYSLLYGEEENRIQNFLNTIGEMWTLNTPIQWSKLFEKNNIVSLPRYEFDRKRHWLDVVKKEKKFTETEEQNVSQITLETSTEINDGNQDDVLENIQQEVTEIWKDILGVGDFSESTTFFELDGHSLTMIQMIGRVRDSFGVELSIKSIFEKPTTTDISEMILHELLGVVES